MNYTEIDLPSHCQLYEDVDKKNVKIREFTGEEEELIAETRPVNFEKTIKTLISRTVTGIPDVGKLTLGDRMYILFWHIVNSCNPMYDTQITCSECLIKSDISIDMSNLDIIEMPQEFSGKEQVILNDGTSVDIRLLTMDDEIDIARYENENEKSWAYRYAKTIVNNDDIIKRMLFYKSLGSKDTAKIRAVQEKYKHGPNLNKAKYVCPKCGYVGEVACPFRVEMLLPANDALKRFI